jgi:hypothetical protein
LEGKIRMRSVFSALRTAMAVMAVALVLSPFVGSILPARAASPQLKVDPGHGLPGSKVTVSGTGFTAKKSGSAWWDENGDVEVDFTTDANGAFQAQIDVPNLDAGNQDIGVSIGDYDGSVTFVVDSGSAPTQPTQAPTQAPAPGDQTTPEATPTKTATAEPTKTTTPAPNESTGSTIWVSTSGSDSASGSSSAPFKTLQKALDVVKPGMTINLKSGKYSLSSTANSKTNGSSSAPITIQSAPNERAVLAGPASSRGVQINNAWYIIRNLEFTGADNLLWLDGATNVVITGNNFHDAYGECVRIKNQSKNITFSHNTVTTCGLEGFDVAAGHKNGEGVYIGTAPEQRYKIGGVPDYTTGVVVEYNTIRTNGSEAVDIKEDAEGNIVRYNVGSYSMDPDGAVFGARGDKNQFIGNEASGGAGAGFRAGGDTVDGRVYGKNNVYSGNYSHNNASHSFKFMVGPQTVDCTNKTSGDGGQMYYFGTSSFTIACSGSADSGSTGSDTGASAPTPTPAPSTGPTTTKFTPTDDTQANSASPDTKYGSATTMRVDGSPQVVTYLKFSVSNVSGKTVKSAKLRVYVKDGGGAPLTLQQVGSKSWTEGGLNWSNRPSVGGTIWGKKTSSSASGTWVEFDLTKVVTANGTYSMALWSTSGDGYSFNTSEASSNKPQLVVVTE